MTGQPLPNRQQLAAYYRQFEWTEREITDVVDELYGPAQDPAGCEL